MIIRNPCGKCGAENMVNAPFCANCGMSMTQLAGGPGGTNNAPIPQRPPFNSATSVHRKQYCASCGKELVSSAIICPACGSATGKRKDKSIAVLLAVFLGFWTWAYTYDRDKAKFWVGLGLFAFGVFTLAFGIGALILGGVWLWSIIAVATRPSEFYEYFPNR